jgi:hypothetical protein
MNRVPEIIWYLLPVIPIGIRLIFGVIHWRRFRDPLSPGEADAESHRTVVVALAGFSFTGLMALVVVDAATRTNYQLAIYFLLVSFLCYLFVLNLQGYKLRRWHDAAGDAVLESASLSLIMAVISAMRAARLESSFVLVTAFLSILVWGLDFLVRVILSHQHLSRIGGQYDRAKEKPHPPTTKANRR